MHSATPESKRPAKIKLPAEPVAAVVATRIQPDGLRYKSKPTGSAFSMAGKSMSCIKCGKHRPRTMLQPFKLAGAQHYRCGPSCDELSKTLEG